MQEISIPSNVTEIGGYAFYFCYDLQKAELKQGLQSIGEAAFNRCSSIKEIYIPEGVTAINSLTFSDCSSLEYIYIPKSVTRISNNAFSSCVNLYEIDISTQSESYKYDDASGILTNIEGTAIVFMSGRVLQSVDELSIPQGITSFQTSISSYSNITKIVIPESLTALGNANLFPTSISDVEIQGNNNYFFFFFNCLYTKEKTALITALYQINGNFTVRDTVEVIGSQAFRAQVNMSGITLPEGLKEIEDNVFMYCEKITSIYIPNSVEKISSGAFGASGIREIKIDKAPGTIEGAPWGATIGDRAIEWLRD